MTGKCRCCGRTCKVAEKLVAPNMRDVEFSGDPRYKANVCTVCDRTGLEEAVRMGDNDLARPLAILAGILLERLEAIEARIDRLASP